MHILRFIFNTSNMSIIRLIFYNKNEAIQVFNLQSRMLKISDNSSNTKNELVSICEPIIPNI